VSLFSLGKTGRALHLMENPDSLANYLKIYRDVQGFLGHRSLVDRFAYVENMVGDSKKINAFFDILTHILRSKVLGGDKLSEKYLNTLSKIEEAGMLLRGNVNAHLVLENLMLCL